MMEVVVILESFRLVSIVVGCVEKEAEGGRQDERLPSVLLPGADECSGLPVLCTTLGLSGFIRSFVKSI